MGVGHAGGELEALINTVGLLLLHAHGVVLGLGVLLSICLVHCNFSDDLISEAFEDGIEQELNVVAGLLRLGLNELGHSVACVFLSLSELVDGFKFRASAARVDKLVARHVNHELSVGKEMLSEFFLEDEQVLLKLVHGLHLVVLLDSLLPEAHEFPGLELLEEAEVPDVVVTVTLDQPLAKRHEFNGRVLLVEGETLATDGVVLVISLAIAAGLQIVGVVLVGASQVCENRFFFAAGVQQKLDVLVELAPLLGLLRFLTVLLT